MNSFESKTDPKNLVILKKALINSRILDWGSDYNKNAGITFKNLKVCFIKVF